MPSLLRRTGAAVCVCVILGGTLSACAPRKTTAPTPTPSPSFNPHFEKSAELAANLQSLGDVSGNITGIMTVGSDKRPLVGSVALSGADSKIRFVETGKASYTFAETIVDGNRYTSRDDKTWVFRGLKNKAQNLSTLLASADTSLDAGISTVNKVSAHKILTAQDKVDVAPALGLDTWTFDQETTTLRVWADDAGKVLGFGASMSWQLMITGEWVDVTAELDVMLSPAKGLSITAPKDPWKWVQDTASGFAYGDPGNLVGVRYKIETSHALMAKSVTLASDLKAVVDDFSKTGIVVSGAKSIVVDGEDAYWFTIEQSGAHAALLMVIHERMEYGVVVGGLATDKAVIDANALQIFSTVQFTR